MHDAAGGLRRDVIVRVVDVMPSPIIFAIPVFFLLIGLEWAYSRYVHRDVYDFRQAVSDVSCGIGNQAAALIMRGMLIAGYVVVWEHLRLFDWPRKSVLPYAAAVLGYDFCYYWWHRCSHRVTGLWIFHIVHHQSRRMNLAVALRVPWLSPITNLPFFLPLAVLGLPIEAYAIGAAASLVYQIWIHTELVGRLGPLEAVLNTPSHHRVHHGTDEEYLDSNYGGILIVWDKLFGTFKAEAGPVHFGTLEPWESLDPVRANIVPFVETFKAARDAARERGSAWAFVGELLAPPRAVGVNEAGADDVKIGATPMWLRWLVLWQCGVTLVVLLVTLGYRPQLSWPATIVMALAIVTAPVAWIHALNRRASWPLSMAAHLAVFAASVAFGLTGVAGVGLSAVVVAALLTVSPALLMGAVYAQRRTAPTSQLSNASP